jgi:ParB family chromosome partitioning protein
MKRIAEKSKLINLPPATPPVPRQAPLPARQPGERSAADGIASATANPPSGSGSTSRSFTGVGAMMAALGQGGTLGRELEEVKARLAEFEGSIPVRLLDPKLIRPGRFANRHQTEYGSPAFLELKREIEQARVNVQPIKVRPGEEAGTYEIVFGHRRHRACLDLGFEVLAIVEDVSDRDLWLQMDQENRGRRDLSPWEQGRSIQAALRSGLFPSVRQLADSAGIDFSNAAKLLKLAELPDDVVAAFEKPTDLQVHWAGLLSKALQADPESVLERAKVISTRGTVPRSSKQILAELLGEPAPTAVRDRTPVTVSKDGVTLATIRKGTGQRVVIEIHRPVDLQQTAAQVARWLDGDPPRDE